MHYNVSDTVTNLPGLRRSSAGFSFRDEATLLLSLPGLRDRIALATAIGLSFVMQIQHSDSENTIARVESWRHTDKSRFCLCGDFFSTAIRNSDIGSIALITTTTARNVVSISIQNRAGAVILSLFGANGDLDSVLWNDLMGNPCQPDEC